VRAGRSPGDAAAGGSFDPAARERQLMSHSTDQVSPPAAPAHGRARDRAPPRPPDRQKAKLVVLGILQAAPCGLTSQGITSAFWLAHLYYAKHNPGYLTDWPLLRSPGGADLRDGTDLLRELEEENLVVVGHEDLGPIPLAVYRRTEKQVDALPAGAAEAIERASRFLQDEQAACRCPGGRAWAWLVPLSRAWRTTPDGQELDVYLDLIPEDVYHKQGRILKDVQKGLEDLFS
jgi:hypothetical protein